MSESLGDVVAEQIQSTQRVAELEIEVARLVAELDEARGGDTATGVSRFLTIAASTIDQAAVEISDEAEAAVARASTAIQQRLVEAEQATAAARAESDAARAAAAEVTIGARRELEKARTSATALAEDAAAAAEETHRAAKEEAEQITAAARNEASMAIATERQRFTREVDALTDIREALIKERHALETYHGQLKARVRELAQAMVTFMTSTSEDESLEALTQLTTLEIEGPSDGPTVPSLADEQDESGSPAEAVVDVEPEDDVTDEGYPVEAYDASFAAVNNDAPTTEATEVEADGSEPEATEVEAFDSEPEDLFSDSFGLESTDQTSTGEVEETTKPVPGSSRPVVEVVPLAHEPEPDTTATPVGGHGPVDDTASESSHTESKIRQLFSQLDESGVDTLAEPKQEDAGRAVDESEPPISSGPILATPIEPASLVTASDGDDDLFGPVRPGERSDLPFSLGRLIVERRGGKLENDDSGASANTAEDDQFEDFVDEDDDDASRGWFRRRDES